MPRVRTPRRLIVTAADTGDASADVVLETPGFRLILHALTEWPLAIARQMNQRTHRTFSPLIGTSWLLGLELTANVTPGLDRLGRSLLETEPGPGHGVSGCDSCAGPAALGRYARGASARDA